MSDPSSPAPGPAQSPTPSPASSAFSPQQRWVLGQAAGASFMAALDGMAVTTALDAIRRDLGSPLAVLHWTMTAYSLSFAALLMAGAALGDRLGRRRMFIAGLLLFAASSVACAAAPSTAWLIGARAVQGAASALLVPLAMALLGSVVTPAQRPRAMGLFSGLTGLALVLGPVAGGFIVDALHWRWVFWINVPLCAVAAVLAATRLPHVAPVAQRMDWPGSLLAAVAMAGGVWALSEGNALGWASLLVAGAIALALVMAGLFLWRQHAVAHALVPPRLLHSQPFRVGNAVGLLLFASLMGTLLFMAPYFQAAHHTDASGAGARMLPWTVALFAAMPFTGALAGRIGEKPAAVAGLLLQSVALVWMSSLASADHPYYHWLVPLALAGVGLATAMPAVQSAVLGSVAPPDMGKASGVFNTMRQLGWACGAAGAVATFSGFGSLGSPQQVAQGFVAVLLMAAALSALGAAVALRLRPAAASMAARQPGMARTGS